MTYECVVCGKSSNVSPYGLHYGNKGTCLDCVNKGGVRYTINTSMKVEVPSEDIAMYMEGKFYD